MAEIEFVMLCDAAQSIDGKLYILGGAWSQIRRQVLAHVPPEQQPPTQFAIAASIEVDWNEANDPTCSRSSWRTRTAPSCSRWRRSS
jgi:hypothetical protein